MPRDKDLVEIDDLGPSSDEDRYAPPFQSKEEGSLFHRDDGPCRWNFYALARVIPRSSDGQTCHRAAKLRILADV